MTDLLTRTLVSPPAQAPGVGNGTDVPASSLADTVAYDLALAVAPSTGRFHPETEAGTRMTRGALIGHVTGGGGRADAVHAPVDSVVADLLVRPGQLVRRGQGLAWLRRSEEMVA